MSATKVCTRCGEEKPRAAFYSESGRCKPCARLAAKEWRESHLEEARAAQIRRHRERPHLQAARSRRHYLANIGKMKARAALFDRENPEQHRERVRRRRARMSGAAVERVDYRLIRERDGDICHICDLPIDDGAIDFDHVIPIARGGEHSSANIRVAHASCNRRKGARLMEELAA